MPGEHCLGRPLLHHPAGIHHQHVGGDLRATTPRSWLTSSSRHRATVRRQGRQAGRGCCACTVTSSAVVGSSAISSVGIAGQRRGDHHALALAAGELVRIGVRSHARRRECRPAPATTVAVSAAPPVTGHPPMLPQRLGDLIDDAHERIERRHRLLEHHARCARHETGTIRRLVGRRNRSSPVEASARPVARAHSVGSSPIIASASHRLAAAALAHQPHGVAAERCPDRCRRAARARRRPTVTLSRSRTRSISARVVAADRASRCSPSPSRFSPSTDEGDRKAGEQRQQRCAIDRRSARRSASGPSSAIGGCVPRPT